MGGTGNYAPCAYNGYGRNYIRGTSQKTIIIPWIYRKPFIIKKSLNDCIRVLTAEHTPHTGSDFLNVTYYVEEDLE
jgi:hypothetical protein